MKKKTGLFDIINGVILTIVCISMLYPFLNAIVKSFSGNSEIMRGNVYLWPKGFTLSGYIELFNDPLFCTSLKNSLYIVLVGTFIRLVVSLMAGYAFSKDRLKYRKILFFLFIFTMFFGGGIVPTFIIINKLGLYDTLWVLILMGSMPVYHMILAMSFFKQLPSAVEEAAFVDGASFMQIFIKIILPMSKPLIATLTIFNAVALYNLFMQAVIFTQSPQNFVMQTYVRLKVFAAEAAAGTGDMQTIALIDAEDSGTETLKMAVLSLSSIPIVLVYPFFQRFFIKGVTLGAVKS